MRIIFQNYQIAKIKLVKRPFLGLLICPEYDKILFPGKEYGIKSLLLICFMQLLLDFSR